MKLNATQSACLTKFRDRLPERGFCQDLFALIDERPTREDLDDTAFDKFKQDKYIESDNSGRSDGEIVDIFAGEEHHLAYADGNTLVYLKPSDPDTSAVPIDAVFNLTSDMIENYNKPAPIETSVGIFLLNYRVFADVTGDRFEYNNETWNPGKMEDLIAESIMNETITVQEGKRMVDAVYSLGSISDLFVMTATAKSFTTNPELAKRKKELLEEYADSLHDPVIMRHIEEELEAIDREWVKGDDSEDFYNAMGKKAYSVHRKNMFVAQGATESFDKTDRQHHFITNSLSEGWDVNDFVHIVNELRKGSYNRGKETELGGALAKTVQRVFQSLSITEDNCGTTRGLIQQFTNENAHHFIGRTVFDGRKEVMITKDTASGFTGRTLKMRSPMYCETKDGLCFTCMGNRYRELNRKGVHMEAVAMAYTFQTAAMKAMHGNVLETEEINVADHLLTG